MGGSFYYTPEANFYGTDSLLPVSGTATDTGKVTIDVTSVNDAPSASDDTRSMSEDSGALSITLNMSDVDGDTLTVGNIMTDNGGQVVLSDDGQTMNYTPAQHFNGVEEISYTVTDGNGGVDSATITVNVASVNDAPQGSAVAALVDGVEDQAYTVSIDQLVEGFSDVDGDNLSVSNVFSSSGTPQ